VFLLMEYCAGGELFCHLMNECFFLEKDAKFYIAEMVLALEHLHHCHVIHRDLKPENVLLGQDGHIRLTDFGLSREDYDESTPLRTVCGTNHYMAPEMIRKSGYNKAVDWWSLGAIAYEMMVGSPPFDSKNPKELDEKILSAKVKFPNYLSQAAVTLIKGFLNRDPDQRLGGKKSTMFEIGGVAAIKQQNFFKTIDWNDLISKHIPPPIKINISGTEDTSYFLQEFTSMEIKGKISNLAPLVRPRRCTSGTFDGFNYVAPDFQCDLNLMENENDNENVVYNDFTVSECSDVSNQKGENNEKNKKKKKKKKNSKTEKKQNEVQQPVKKQETTTSPIIQTSLDLPISIPLTLSKDCDQVAIKPNNTIEKKNTDLKNFDNSQEIKLLHNSEEKNDFLVQNSQILEKPSVNNNNKKTWADLIQSKAQSIETMAPNTIKTSKAAPKSQHPDKIEKPIAHQPNASNPQPSTKTTRQAPKNAKNEWKTVGGNNANGSSNKNKKK